MKKITLVTEYETEDELYDSWFWDRIGYLIASNSVLSFQIEDDSI